MILCVCLNPAIDTTYSVDELQRGSTHRVGVIGQRAGGKALNVARVLHRLGEPLSVTGLIGGTNGDSIRTDLDAAAIPADFVHIGGQSRRTVTVVDHGEATLFNEPGPVVSASEWAIFLAHYSGLVKTADVVVLSGSQPPGVPVGGYARLTSLARSAGAAVLLDAAGPALTAALSSGPDLVKPNRSELTESLGHPVEVEADILDGCQRICDQGAGAVLVSLGASGVVAKTRAGAFRVRAPVVRAVNPTGAGDALAASTARGMRRADSWPTLLAEAVALATASVTMATAGATDHKLAAELLPSIQVEMIP